MQPVDFTTLAAACAELRRDWLPARLEAVYQRDRFTVCLSLRTLQRRGWLTLSWHPQAARLHLGDRPPRDPDTFTFSQQLLHQLKGLALVAFAEGAPWERVVDLQFAARPGDPVRWHLYAEVMGKYSNAVLTQADGTIVTAAHQVSDRQSSIRPIQTGQPYQLPPKLLDAVPNPEEPRDRWQERVALVPGPIARQLLKTYRGLSSPLARSLTQAAGIDPETPSDRLTDPDWRNLFQIWQTWLQALETGTFAPVLQFAAPQPTPTLTLDPSTWPSAPLGYSVLGPQRWAELCSQRGDNPPQLNPSQLNPSQLNPSPSLDSGTTGDRQGNPAASVQQLAIANVQDLLNRYYTDALNRDTFTRLRQQLRQKLASLLGKLRKRLGDFQRQVDAAADADRYRAQADLLMAHLHEWAPGMAKITLADFETGEPVAIALDPTRNAVQNAQQFYKKHQKLRRSRQALDPLIAEVQSELDYLDGVETAIEAVERYDRADDLAALEDIRDELVREGYLADPGYQRRDRPSEDIGFHRFSTPDGLEIWIGRNNAQNDRLTFRLATDYDWWFHTQEIPGSHVLLRLPPGAVASDRDLQTTADLAAYFSRARQSDQVPVVYTRPKHVYKPKGAKPGTVLYKQEQILWGQPQRAKSHPSQRTADS